MGFIRTALVIVIFIRSGWMAYQRLLENETDNVIYEDTQLLWSGGGSTCSTCDPGYDLVDNFACSESSRYWSPGFWNNGTQVFLDPLTQDPNKPLEYVLSQIVLSVSGQYNCKYSPIEPELPTIFSVFLQGTLLVSQTFQTRYCTCGKCSAALNATTIENPDGWPNYQYNNNNTVTVNVTNSVVCLSAVYLRLIYTKAYNGGSSADSTNSTSHGLDWKEVLIWGGVWVACLLFLCFFVIGLLVLQRYRRFLKKRSFYSPIIDVSSVNSMFEGESENSKLRDQYNNLFKIDGSELKLGPRIGKGSYGDVYKADWRGIVVAVKKLPLYLLDDKQFLKDFNQEAIIMSSLRHPNVLLYLGTCVIEKDICIVTEFMAKGSLYKLLHDDTFEMAWDLIKKFALDTAQGMLYLHSTKPPLIHRDLKSHNLLVDEKLKLKISDFGLSKVLDHCSKTMTSCGTASWAAPEVLKNSRYSEKADVYSFAICLYEFWTRKDPYEGMSSYQIIFAVGNEGLRPTIPYSCPPDYAKLIIDCWSTDSGQRPTFHEIIQRLKCQDY